MRREIRLTFTLEAAGAVNKRLFIADTDYELLSVQTAFETASTSATLMLTQCANGTAVASGTNMLSATMALSGTAATNATGSLSAASAARKLPKGYGLGAKFAGTTTNLAGATITVVLQRTGPGVRS